MSIIRDFLSLLKTSSGGTSYSNSRFSNEFEVWNGAGPDVSREGVQRDLLPIVEGSNVSTKYGVVVTDHILFIAAGAFHVSTPSDMIPELQGRFPIRVELDKLNTDDFVKILTHPRSALIKQYTALLSAENVELEFNNAAIRLSLIHI